MGSYWQESYRGFNLKSWQDSTVWEIEVRVVNESGRFCRSQTIMSNVTSKQARSFINSLYGDITDEYVYNREFKINREDICAVSERGCNITTEEVIAQLREKLPKLKVVERFKEKLPKLKIVDLSKEKLPKLKIVDLSKAMNADDFIEQLSSKSREYATMNGVKVIDGKGNPITGIKFDIDNDKIIINIDS